MGATAPRSQFGPFVLDRTRYEVRRGTDLVELTPKLIDLLVHLVDHAGDLVTKEQLLDALWPDANVTDNALTQAVSELRAALGDDPTASEYIKTVARRGYRFVAAVTAIVPPACTPAKPAAQASWELAGAAAIAVMDFVNLSRDPESAWLSAGIAETVTADFAALERYRVVDCQRVSEALRRTDGLLRAVAADLGLTLAVIGSCQTQGGRIRITSRLIDIGSGEALADAKVDGLLADIFQLQDQVVAQFSEALGLKTTVSGGRAPRETASLEAYRRFTEGWLELETLEVEKIPVAIEHFKRAIVLDPRYAIAYTGLANAELAAYENTRAENHPSTSLLQTAIAHARKAIALDDDLAEAHSTLAFVLVSDWQIDEARQSAGRAVAMEPANWKHHFRLGHASWGADRLSATGSTLLLYPDFAFAHFQGAMVHVARGRLRHAETMLRQGAAIQDRQIHCGERYPALGLHWLLALVRLAQDDPEDALREIDREHALAETHRLYGREYEMSALSARGACQLRVNRPRDAAASFRDALALYPAHAQSLLGLALAQQAMGDRNGTAAARLKLDAALEELGTARPFEASIVRGQLLATDGRLDEAARALQSVLDRAPCGFAAWTLPVEPFLYGFAGDSALSPVFCALAERAR